MRGKEKGGLRTFPDAVTEEAFEGDFGGVAAASSVAAPLAPWAVHCFLVLEKKGWVIPFRMDQVCMLQMLLDSR